MRWALPYSWIQCLADAYWLEALFSLPKGLGGCCLGKGTEEEECGAAGGGRAKNGVPELTGTKGWVEALAMPASFYPFRACDSKVDGGGLGEGGVAGERLE